MTVKELKDKLNEYDDRLIVMIPHENRGIHLYFPYIEAGDIYQGVNEVDGCLFIEDGICCETCVYDDNDVDDHPCCSCIDGENWEERKDD